MSTRAERIFRAAVRAARDVGKDYVEQFQAGARAVRAYAQLDQGAVGQDLAGSAGRLPFHEAIRAAAERDVVLPDAYYGELQDQARISAFSVAGETRLAQLEQTLGELQRVMADGGTLRDFQRRVRSGDAPLNLPRHRIENILRTNTQGAFARGRCVHFARHKETRPYLRYSAVNDDRTRPHHAAMHGMVAAQDDPVWATWMPPVGFQCRCTVTSLSERQAKRYRARDEQRMTPERRMAREDARPDEGWAYNPCDDPDQGQAQALQRHGARMPTPIARQARRMTREVQRRTTQIRARTREEVKELQEDDGIDWGEVAEGERREHDDAFALATDRLKETVRSTPALHSVKRASKGAHYEPGRGWIDMDGYRFGRGDNRAVFRHEYGHHVDFAHGYSVDGERMPLSAGARNEIRRDRKRIRDALKQGGRTERIMEDHADMRDIMTASRDGGRAEIKRRFLAMGIDDEPIERALRQIDTTDAFVADGVPSNRASVMAGLIARLESNRPDLAVKNFSLSVRQMVDHLGDAATLMQRDVQRTANMLSDFVEAVSDAAAGYGHGKNYYKKFAQVIGPDGKEARGIRIGHTTEAMADWTAMEGLPDEYRAAFQELARYFAPETHAKLGQLIDEVTRE